MRRAALLACAIALAGCGLGEGEERSGRAELRITRDFGHQRIGSAGLDPVREDQTVMRLLRSEFDVDTRFGGRFVQAIEGLAGRGATGRRDWFFFVNGIESDVGAAEYELSPGDVVQWDYRSWRAAMRVPATVGAFPQPFRDGLKGKRFPVRVECEDSESDPCREAKRRLRALGVTATGASLGAAGTENVIRVVVARWPRARLVRSVAELDGDPGDSGVFARFADGGRSLELLGPGGEVARRASAGTGVVAALSPSQTEIVWVLTALDEAGLSAAARALDERALRDAYAVAAGPRGVEKLPLGAG